jgi:hypothetical protein
MSLLRLSDSSRGTRSRADDLAVLGLRSFWMQGGEALAAIGALDQSKEERKRLAKLYVLYNIFSH